MKKNATIPMRSIWSSLIALAIIGFTYIQAIGYIIPGFEEIFKLTKETTTIEDIGLMWVPVISYLLICSFFCMVVRIFKDLKPYKEKGLIAGLIFGLIVGLIVCLIAGLIFGLIVGLIVCLIAGLIFGLIAGLIAGLIVCLTAGLREELGGFTSLDYQAFFIIEKVIIFPILNLVTFPLSKLYITKR